MGNDLRALKAMVSVMNPSGVKASIFKGVKLPYKRKKEVVKRKAYDQAEARLRKEVIKELRRRGYKVWRIETAIMGQLGLPDLLIMKISGGQGAFIELKTPQGYLSKEQVEFCSLCDTNRMYYYIVRSMDDLDIFL